jgi:hypothetical protein
MCSVSRPHAGERDRWLTIQHLPGAAAKIIELQLLAVAVYTAEPGEVVPVLLIADRPRLGDTGPARSNITEDGPLRPLLILLQADTVRGRPYVQIVDLCQGREFTLEGIVSQRQGHSKKHQAADEIVALIESKYLPI